MIMATRVDGRDM